MFKKPKGKGHRHDLSGVPIIVTENVEDYRNCIPEHVKPNDVAIELGCAQGITTSVIAQFAKEVVGIDKSEFNFAHAAQRHPNITFHNLDAFDISSILKLGKRFTKVFIDVSGNRPVGDVVQLIESYERVFSPDLFIVKCYKLKRLIGLCTLYPEQARSAATTGEATAVHGGMEEGHGAHGTASMHETGQAHQHPTLESHPLEDADAQETSK